MSRVAIPDNADDLRNALHDRTFLSNVMGDPESLANFIENYSDLVLTKDKNILDQVKEQTETTMLNFLREHGQEIESIRNLNLDPNSRKPVAKGTLYNKKALGAKHDGDFADATEFFFNISEHSYKNAELSKKLEGLSNSLSSVRPADGGYLIPETLRAELLQLSLETSIVRSRARVIPMDSLSVEFPAVDSTSNVSSVYGGIVGYWTEEGATLTESQPRFGRVKLTAHKLTLYTEMPSELIRDAQPSMTALIDQMFPEAMGWFEDVAFFVGGGVGEPLGFMKAPAQIPVTRNAGGLAVEWVDIVNMYCRMLPQSLGRAVWVVSPDVLPSLLQMTLPGGTSPVILGGGNFVSGSAAPYMSLLGLPIIVSEKASASGTLGDVNLVDFGFYLIGDRQAMSARQSEDYRFKNDVTAFRVTERLDGRPWLLSPVTPRNGGNTLSAFVALS